jgi:succinoglycan biosynthesis transport protein ExoP
MNPDQGPQIQDLGGMLRRRRGVVAVLAGGVFLASIVVAAVLPNVYEAWTTVLVEPQSISPRLVEAGLEGAELESRLHLMTMQILSRGRLSRIITDLDLYPEESKAMTREEVISLMRDDIHVEPVVPELAGGTGRRDQRDFEINTFRLYFRSKSATTAAAVANRLANDFIDEHLRERVQISGDTSEFIEAELDRLSSRIAEVEARIAAVKDENPGRLPEDVATNQRLMERAMESLRQAQGDFATAKSDEAFYKQQVLSGGLFVGQQPLTPERKLEVLELLLAEYRGRGYTEKHPDVVSTQQEIAAVEAQIDAGKGSDEGEKAPASLAQQNARAEEQRAALRVTAASEDIQRVNAQIAEIQQRLVETPRVAEQLAALDREYEHLFRNFQEFSNKRLEAGVAANMERRQKGEQFRILESAFPATQPSSPNRLMIAAIGLVFGLALGAGVAVLLEVLDSSFHGARQLQTALRFPVLASIPGIVLESDRVAMRRRRIRNAVAAVAVTFVVLAGAVAGNWTVNGVPGFVQSIIDGEGAETPTPPAGEQG